MSDFGLQGMLYELILLSLYMCGAVPSCSVVSNSLGPIDCSPRGSSVHGTLQARILGWVSMSSSRVSSQARDPTQVSCVAGEFFTNWATREARMCVCVCVKLFKTELKSDAGGESFPGKRCWLNHLLTWLEKTFVNVIVKTLLCVEHSAMALFGPFSSFKKKTYYKWNEWAIIHAVCQLEWWMGSRKK